MLTIIDVYVIRTLLATVFTTLMTLVGLSSLIKFVEQLRKVGEGDFDLLVAAIYVLYSMPRDLEEFFPMATLIGGLVGMGVLASNSELIVMQAAGMSKSRIIGSAMKGALVMALIIFVIGEYVSPLSETKAKEIRNRALSGGEIFRGSNSVWTKDGLDFVQIGNVFDQRTLGNVTIYSFNEDYAVKQVINAATAQFSDDAWQLSDVVITYFFNDQVSTNNVSLMRWQAGLTPDKLSVATVKPEALSIQGLSEYVEYLDNNQQDSSRYQLAMWRKIVQPITVCVMLLMAFSFIFGPLRSTSMGARIIIGIITGFSFFIANQVFGPFALVYNLPAFLGALLPSAVFALVAAVLLQRAK